jgi:excisionase family DNA binding protein
MTEFGRPLSVSEAAAMLGLTDYLVRQAIRDGLLDAFRVGRTLRIRPASVSRLLRGDGQAAAASDPAT